MIEKTESIRIRLPARSENVAVVRHSIAGLAEALGMSEESVGDFKTVVTEACMNVVQHAYPGGTGPLEVTGGREGDRMVVTVVDEGVGIRPHSAEQGETLRLGISLISTLSESFEIAGRRGRGTRITIRLPLSGDAGGSGVNGDRRPDGEAMRRGATEVQISDGEMLAPVLSRIISVLGARNDMSVDHLSDALLLTEAITARPEILSRDEGVGLEMTDGDGMMHLRVGPLRPGMADELRRGLRLPEEIGGSLEALAEDVSVELAGEEEYLRAEFAI